jgi:DNA polymerase delta subunit 3
MEDAKEEEEEEEVEVLPKKKRQPKKVIPVGSNGIKKKRVMKSRMHTDEKGFMGESVFNRLDTILTPRSDGGLL